LQALLLLTAQNCQIILGRVKDSARSVQDWSRRQTMAHFDQTLWRPWLNMPHSGL